MSTLEKILEDREKIQRNIERKIMQAFPTEQSSIPGMTLRDYFAAHALSIAADLVKNSGFNSFSTTYENRVAEEAYDIAKAMLSRKREIDTGGNF